MNSSSPKTEAVQEPMPARLKLISFSVLGLSILAVAGLKMLTYRRGYYSIDLALYSNMLYNAAFRGRGLFTQTQFLGMGYSSYLNDHFAPSLYCLVPFFRLDPDPRLLLLIPCFSFLLSAWFIYQIAERVLGRNLWAYLAALGFCLAPTQIWLAVDIPHGFHHDCLIPLMAFASILAWQQNSKLSFWICLILFLGLRENLPFYAAAVAFLAARRKIIPWSTAKKILILSALFFLAALCYGFWSGHNNRSFERAWDLIQTIPSAGTLAHLWDWRWLLYFWPVFVWCPIYCIPVLADLVLMVLAGEYGSNWHSFPSLTLLSLAWIDALHIIRGKGKFWSMELRKSIWLLIALSLMWGLGKNIEIFAKGLETTWERPARYADAEVLAMQALIPQDAVLATATDLLPRFCNQEKLLWIYQWDSADYVLLNLPERSWTPTLMDADTVASILANLKDGQFQMIQESPGGLLLLKRLVKSK